MKPKDLDNHERQKHAFAIGVNRRGRSASSDMELCTICNLYLDPGVSIAFSSHLRTSYHLHKLSEYQASSSFDAALSSSSIQNRACADPIFVSHSSLAASDVDVTEVDVIALFEKARDVHGYVDENTGDGCSKRLLDECFGEDDSSIPADIGNISHVDWMLDRNDKLLYDLHPDIGYVFLCEGRGIRGDGDGAPAVSLRRHAKSEGRGIRGDGDGAPAVSLRRHATSEGQGIRGDGRRHLSKTVSVRKANNPPPT